MLGSMARALLWGPCCSPKHTCVLNEQVLGIPLRREKCPLRVLAELQGGEWGCLQDTSGIANWPAGTSGLTHFPFKRRMSRSVELVRPGSAWLGPAGPAKQISPVPSLQAGSRSSMSSTPLDPTVHPQSTSCSPHQWYLAGKALPPHSASGPFSHLAGCSFWMFLLVLLFPDFQTLSARGAVLGPLPLSFHTPFLRGLHQYPQLLLATPKLICLPWTSSLN